MRPSRRFAPLLVVAALACLPGGGVEVQGLPASVETKLFGRRPMARLHAHEGIWEDVKNCLASLGIEGAIDAPPVWYVRWSVADSLKTADGFWAYGLTIYHDGAAPPEIILEAPYWLNPGIISHEAIHVITRDASHEGEAWGCEMPSYDALPPRYWTEGVPARRNAATQD